MKYPFQGRSLRKGGKSKGGKGKQGKSKGKGSSVPRLAGSSGRTAREEEKARSLERKAVHLLARRVSPKKKLRKRRLRTMRC